MVFHTANKHVAYPKLNINGNNIERVTNFNFLGLTLSSTLSWNQHINKISLTLFNMAYLLHFITCEGAENNPLHYLEIYT